MVIKRQTVAVPGWRGMWQVLLFWASCRIRHPGSVSMLVCSDQLHVYLCRSCRWTMTIQQANPDPQRHRTPGG